MTSLPASFKPLGRQEGDAVAVGLYLAASDLTEVESRAQEALKRARALASSDALRRAISERLQMK